MTCFHLRSGLKSSEILNDSRVQLMTNSPCGGIFALREVSRYLKDFRGMTVRQNRLSSVQARIIYGLLIQLLGNDKGLCGGEKIGYRKRERIQ